ncbi:hypothetical protein [Streptomyces sp. NPDC005148]
MSAVPPRAVALAGMLAAVTGNEPRTTTTANAVRVEADLPDELTHGSRKTILTALAIADRYGHDRTETSDTVWAELDREAKQ